MRLQHDICWTFEILLLFLRLLIVFSFGYCWCCRHRLLFYFMELLCYVVFVVVADAAAFFQYKRVCKFCLFLCAPFFRFNHWRNAPTSHTTFSASHLFVRNHLFNLVENAKVCTKLWWCTWKNWIVGSICICIFISARVFVDLTFYLECFAICVYAILVNFCICKTCNTKSIYTK